MAVLATSNSITLSTVIDIKGYYRYYLLQPSTSATPDAPTVYPPTGDWTDTEPAYTSNSTNSLYIVDCTEFNDGTWEYSDVSLSSSYEAAKQAYNKADAAQADIDNLSVGGRNFVRNSEALRSLTRTMTKNTVYLWNPDNPWLLSDYAKAILNADDYPETLVVSFDAKASKAGCTFGISVRSDASQLGYLSVAALVKSANTWARYSIPLTRNSGSDDYVLTHLRANLTAPSDGSATFEIRRMKLELGNRSTDWTPAPEDTDADITAAQTAADGAAADAAAAQATADAKADPMTATAHGGEIVVSDSADAAIGGLVLYGRSTQSGTPSPASPVDIVTAGSGGALQIVTTGKNLIEDNLTVGYTNTANGVTVTKNADGTYTLNGTATAQTAIILNFASPDAVVNTQNDEKSHVRPGTYTVSGLVTDTKLYIIAANNPGNTGVEAIASFLPATPTATVPSGWKYTWIRLTVLKNATFNNTIVHPMLRPSEIEDDTWEPYKAAVTALPTPNGLPGIAVSSGGNYTDESGQQWICDTIDLAAGTYVQRVGRQTFDGSSGWYASTSMGTGITGKTRYIYNGVPYLRPAANTERAIAMCDQYPVIRVQGADDGILTAHTGIGFSSAGSISVYDSQYGEDGTTGFTAWKAMLAANPMHCLFALATPVTTPLTEAQLTALRSIRTRAGSTVLTNDAGADMDLTYATRTGGGSYVEGVRQGLDDGVNRAQAAADAAQTSADAAAATADALDDIFNMWYSFTDEGMIVQKKYEDGTTASIWSTLTDNEGFHIRRADLAEKVFSAYKDRCRVQKLVIGNTMIKSSGNGGMVWVKAPQD